MEITASGCDSCFWSVITRFSCQAGIGCTANNQAALKVSLAKGIGCDLGGKTKSFYFEREFKMRGTEKPWQIEGACKNCSLGDSLVSLQKVIVCQRLVTVKPSR